MKNLEKLKEEFTEIWQPDMIERIFQKSSEAALRKHFESDLTKLLEQQERETAIKLLNHITRNHSPYAIMYGNQPARFATKDREYTSKQLFDQWKSKTK